MSLLILGSIPVRNIGFNPYDLRQLHERLEILQRMVLKNPIKDLASLLVIVALEIAEKLAVKHLHIAGLADNNGPSLYRGLGCGLFGAGLRPHR
jgi:hypothetical protein